TCCSSSDSMSPPNRKPPTTMVGGSTVLFGWCGRGDRTGSASDASWLGGRGGGLVPAGFPAGPSTLAARDRRGDIVDRQVPGAAARTAGRGVVLHVRRVGGLQPPQGLERGPGLTPEPSGDEPRLFQGGERVRRIAECGDAAPPDLGCQLQQL